MVWIYLDDILVVSSRERALQKHKEIVLQDLTTLGLIVNYKKSGLNPSQQVDYLGFHLDFVKGKLKVPQHKLRTVKKELGKFVTHVSLTPRKMAAILGTIRSFLTAFPFLIAFTDQLVK